jgi:poly(A) polymerase
MDPDAVKVVRRLRQGGYIAYIVGGAIRDLLLKIPPKDFDVATDATPEAVRKLFRNSRMIGKRFRIVHVYFRPKKIIEVSTFRKDPRWSDEEEIPIEAANNQWGTPAEDAFRRDLTINAFFFDPIENRLIDYTGGMDDLRARRIRLIGSPELRLREDPVRALRVIRHSARTRFLIAHSTWEGILQYGELIRSCNIHRVRQELVREFQEGALRNSLKLLLRSGLLHDLLPDLESFLLALESRPLSKRVYWRILDEADKLYQETPLPPRLSLACVFGPVVQQEILGSLDRSIAFRTDLITRRLRPFMTELGLSKSLAEEIAPLIFVQPRLDSFRMEGEFPHALKNKSYFVEAIHLARLRALALSAPIPESWEEHIPPLPSKRIELIPLPPGRNPQGMMVKEIPTRILNEEGSSGRKKS